MRAFLFLAGLALAHGALAHERPRVITLAPHLTELVCAAAGCEALVAVGAYSDFPPEVQRLPRIGDVGTLNLEAVIALKPTHVLVWDGGTPAAQRAQLERLKLPVTALAIERLDEVPAMLEKLGAMLGTKARAAAAARDYRERLARLEARRRALPSQPLRVLYQIETSPVYTVSGKTPISATIALCGGVNVFADLPALAAPVTDEAVLAARPKVVVHAPTATAAVTAYWQRFARSARNAPTLVAIDPDLLARAGPRMVEGAEQLCDAFDRVRAKSE